MSRTQVVVRYRPGVDASRRSKAARDVGSSSTRRIAKLGVDVLAVPDAAETVEALEGRPEVLYAEPLTFASRFAETVGPDRAELRVDEVHEAHSTARGAGQTVAVIDDGVDPQNPDLRGRVVDGGAYYTGARSGSGLLSGAALSTNSHGTAVAAVLAADDRNGLGIKGVVPEATIASYRVFSFTPHLGAPSTAVAAALVQVADDSVMARSRNLNTINLSLGLPYDSGVVRDAVSYVQSRAPWITIVAASGNDFSHRPNFPAGYAGVLSVGASQCVREPKGPCTGVWRQAAFSTKGDVDVLAPGVAVATWEPGTRRADDGSTTADVTRENGTSFAAPQVAGLAAALATAGVTGRAAATAIKASAETAVPGTTRDEPAVGDGSGRADALAAFTTATGEQPYSAVFLTRGQVLGAASDRRRYEAIRVWRAAEPGAPTVTVDAGSIQPAAAPAATEPGIAVATGTYVPPPYDVPDLRPANMHVAGAGEPGDVTPLALVPAVAGDAGKTADDGVRYALRSYSLRDGSGYAFDAMTANTFLRVGQRLPLSVTYAHAESTPLLVFPPPVDGSPTSVLQEEWLELRTIPGCEFADGAGTRTCTLTAPRTGHYAFALINDGDGSTNSFILHPVTAPALTSATRTSPGVPARWGRPRSGLRYDVEHLARTASSPTNVTWRRWLTATTATSGILPARYGETTLIRVRTVRADGSVSRWSPAVRSVSPYDERTRGTSYSRGWTSRDASGRWGRGIRQAKATGSTFTFRTSGYRYAIVGDRCPACGKAKVYVDGRYRGTFDSYSRTGKVRQQLWTATASGGSAQVHTVKVVVQGTSGRPWVKLDGYGAYR